MKKAILEIISERTKDSPILSPEIEQLFEIKGGKVRDIIRELRREGIPIANSHKGYYMASDYSDLDLTIKDLHSRAMSMLVTIKKLRGCFNRSTQFEINYED